MVPRTDGHAAQATMRAERFRSFVPLDPFTGNAIGANLNHLLSVHRAD
jgi:hypothetical protein